MKKIFIHSFFSYILLCFVILLTMKMAFFGDYIIYCIVLFILFMIRDIILIFGVSLEGEMKNIDWKGLWQDRKEKKLSLFEMTLFLNRVIIFPVFLIAYITYILIKQLDISPGVDILFSDSHIEYILLGIVAFSGFLTLFRESLDSTYEQSEYNREKARLYILGSIFLALLGGAIIFSETSSLGLLSIPISSISGLLIFLIGSLLVEEGENPSL